MLITREFLESEERRSLEQRLGLGSTVSLSIDALSYYRNVISIGCHCATAGELKRFGLKPRSYPFDWIFSTIEMTAHCITDDFSIFLDRSFHRRVSDEEKMFRSANACQHIFYKEKFGVDFVFNHKDITKSEEFSYYVRCVERFRAALCSGEPTLLLAISNDPLKSKELNELALAIAPFQGVDALAVCLTPAQRLELSFEQIYSADKVIAFNFQSLGEAGPVKLNENVDEALLREFLIRFDKSKIL